MKLQKAIASAGISSRREAEDLIKMGMVKVNGEIVTEPFKDVDIENDSISVDGKRLKKPPSLVYILMNKPTNCVTTTDDEMDRETVIDLLKQKHRKGKLYPVGRLDFKSEGVLILTNDGDLTNSLIHPKYKVSKVYQIKIQGSFSDSMLKKVKNGIRMKDGNLHFEKISIIKMTEKNSWLEVIIHEGRNRILRRAFEQLRFPILKLKRISFAGLTAKGLAPGEYRFLQGDEIKRLKNLSQSKTAN
jgi:23S rRNA pseudouridine2605 synthase